MKMGLLADFHSKISCEASKGSHYLSQNYSINSPFPLSQLVLRAICHKTPSTLKVPTLAEWKINHCC